MKRKVKKRVLKVRRLLICILCVFLIAFVSVKGFLSIFHTFFPNTKTFYVASSNLSASFYDENYEVVGKIIRGEELLVKEKPYEYEEETYYKISYQGKDYFMKKENLSETKEEIVKEKTMYVRTSATIYESLDSSKILSYGKKGTSYEILGYDQLLEDGSVKKYKIQVGEEVGYIYGKYMEFTQEDALKQYDYNGSLAVHESRGNTQLGGSAINLDYFPCEKPKFEDNVMPDDVRALYLNSSVLGNIEQYITLAKKGNINAFVVDIKDNTAPGYASLVMKELSPTSYEKAINSFETYQAVIKRLKEEGFYVIGRITTFKDSYYIKDHPEDAILNTTTSSPYNHDGSYWPSAFNRNVWEYNVELAKEAVTEMGFNEIQFDYVRFPDRTYSKEKEGIMDFQNEYEEEKAQAIQNFLRYATDEIHALGAYVSADVFGESAHNYVTGYGQYWSAISNVVDVISGMPYPELFNKYEYGFKEPVWTIPYELLTCWAKNYVLKQQALIPTPAVVRTWIQAYDATWKNPKAYYDADMVGKEIQALYDAGFSGFITWNAGSSINKYTSLLDAFKKEY